jgi:acetyltransferase-like isoleucine patch superfamily enzyme
MLGLFKNSPEWLESLEEMAITYLPGPQGHALRYRYWKKRLKYLGENVLLEVGVYLQNPGFISIDDNAWIDRNVILLAGHDDSRREKVRRGEDGRVEPGCVHVGKNIHIGPYCILSGISGGIFLSDDCGISANAKLYAFTHHFRSQAHPGDASFRFNPRVAQERQCLIEGPIYLGANTGVALNSVILPGTSIEENCFVAINSVVGPGRFEPNSLIAGQPAKRIGRRFKLAEEAP